MLSKTLSRSLILLLAAPGAALALGLGDIHLMSALNAPLDAEIELVGAAPEDMAGLHAQVASRETFAKYKLDWPAVMGTVTVQPLHTADGRDVIKVRSTQAITEPFLTLLIEVNWARGRLVREFTMLLDPPVYTPGEAAAAPVAAPQASQGERAGSISRPAPQPEQAASSSPSETAAAPHASAPAAAAGGSDRVVRRGDTLSAISREVSNGGTSETRRWMLAIYQGNPGAFENNMNLLRAGSVLRIPENSAVAHISTSEATAEIRRQYAAWRGSQPAAGADASEPGRLRLVTPPAQANSPAPGPSAGADAALTGRVRELEAQLQESRRLLDVRNAELARLQAQLAAKQGSAATPPPAEETPMEPSAATPPAQTAPVEEAPAVKPDTTAESQPAPVEPAKPAAAPRASSQGEGSLLDTLKEYWWAIAVLLLAVLALVGVKAYRARKDAEFDDSLGRLASAGPSMGADFSGDTAPLKTIGPDVNFLVEESGTHERPKFSGEPAASGPRNVTADDTISSDTAINLDQGDPLAEADFHMAYGLYDQAADLVRIAITRDPQRRDLKLKLLEVFFVWGNREQFLQAARELAESRSEAAPGEWEKIVIMGKQLAPDDPLFSSGGGVSGAAAGGVDLDLEGGESRVDFDLLGEPIPDMGAHEGVDLDIGSALGDRDATQESPTRTTDAHLALHDTDIGDASSATTRQMTANIRGGAEPEPIMPDYGLESSESPTVEQPAYGGGDPTIRQKVDMALRQNSAEQTAELAIDDLGLDLTALDTVDQPGLGSSPDAPTMLAGLDENSRRVMADAERRRMDEEPTGPAATGAWRVSREDLDPTMPPTQIHSFEGGDAAATSRMASLKEHHLDFDFDASSVQSGGAVDLDVGTVTVPDMSHTVTQKISTDDLALPDLEPATMSEVGTKLDLARAYMDMGDPEGARNILEEVLQEGSVTQKQEAQRLLESLPG